MDDALLVSRAKAGDLDAFGQLYDRYFNNIYDFSWRILRNSEEAADVTQDVFMKAMQNLSGLTKAASFKSWLFTIAHNAAVTRAERSGRSVPLPQPVHEEAFGTFDVPDASRLDDPELAAGDAELAALVWEAADALNPRDYALLDLHVRQGLDSAEIAGVMNVSKGNAYTMVSRMKTAAAEVIGSYVVARRGSSDCAGLQETLAAFEFPPYTEQVRKAVDEHITGCETCQGARKRLVAPLEIFGGFAMVQTPLALKGDIWGELSTQWYVTGPGAIGGGGAVPAAFGVGALPPSPYANGGAFGGGDGGLMAIGAEGDGWDRNKIMWFIGGVAGLLIFAFAGGAIISSALGGGGSEGAGDGTATATGTAAVVGTTQTPGVAIQTPTPNLTPSATIPPSSTAGPTESPSPVLPTDTPLPVETPTPEDEEPTETPEPEPTATPPFAGQLSPTPCSAVTTPECFPTSTPTPLRLTTP